MGPQVARQLSMDALLVLTAPEISEHLRHLPQGVPEGRIPVFYSGGDLVRFLWGSTQGVTFTTTPDHKSNPITRPDHFATIDQTEPGKVLASITAVVPRSDPRLNELNRAASLLLAESASGPVICCVLGSGLRSAYSWTSDPAILNALEKAGAKPREITDLCSRGSVSLLFDRTAEQIVSLKDSDCATKCTH